MKHVVWKTLLCLTAVALFSLGMATGVSALESKVVLDGTGNLVTIPGDDLFTELKDMMPGDVGTQDILIHNQLNKKVKLYLKTEVAGFLTPQERERSERLLDALEIKLTLSRAGSPIITLYEGPASGPPIGKEIALGTYSKGAQATITATLTVPAELGNEFQDAAGKVKWVFYCKEVTSSSTSSSSETESDVPVINDVRMPETGGFPLEALLPIGAVLLLGGFALARKER